MLLDLHTSNSLLLNWLILLIVKTLKQVTAIIKLLILGIILLKNMLHATSQLQMLKLRDLMGLLHDFQMSMLRPILRRLLLRL
jgi:hypothetical protein